MNQYDFSTWKCRCSSLGALMTEPQKKSDKEAGAFSEAAKKILIKEFVRCRYGIEDEIDTIQMQKGREQEEESITLLSRQLKLFLTNNKVRLINEFITGEWDIEYAEGLRLVVRDIKTSWDVTTHYAKEMEEPSLAYQWQLNGYGLLMKQRYGRQADELYVDHVLVNTPGFLVDAAVRKLQYNCHPDNFQEEEANLRKRHRVDHIPWRERIITQSVMVFPFAEDRIKEAVTKGRQFLVGLSERMNKKNLLTDLK